MPAIKRWSGILSLSARLKVLKKLLAYYIERIKFQPDRFPSEIAWMKYDSFYRTIALGRLGKDSEVRSQKTFSLRKKKVQGNVDSAGVCVTP